MTSDAEDAAVLAFAKGLVLGMLMKGQPETLSDIAWRMEFSGPDAVFVTPSGRRLRVSVAYD